MPRTLMGVLSGMLGAAVYGLLARLPLQMGDTLPGPYDDGFGASLA